MNRVEEMKKFWNVLDPLDVNEVYVLLLIGKKDGKRQILDTLLVKNNSFEEFFNKVNTLYLKMKRLPFRTELLIDVNRKNVVEGLEKGWDELRELYLHGRDVRGFFSIFIKNIRHSQITNYTMIKDKEFLPEVEPEYVVYDGVYYYHIINKVCERCITKPEIPIPGTVVNGNVIRLHYVNDVRERS